MSVGLISFLEDYLDLQLALLDGLYTVSSRWTNRIYLFLHTVANEIMIFESNLNPNEVIYKSKSILF